ncbi:Hypothetical predicted protein, partial [Olea europaea subsp. europaea]
MDRDERSIASQTIARTGVTPSSSFTVFEWVTDIEKREADEKRKGRDSRNKDER